MNNSIIETNFNFPNQSKVYKGKVRDVYTLRNDLVVMVASDRVSAFDVVMPKGIPYKGQILNQIAVQMMNLTSGIVPNWLISSPDPNVSIGHLCEPFKVEMVIRGYLSGHAAREYKKGKRLLCGVKMPEEMIENDKFPTPIITPATKAEFGNHDEDISKEEIITRNIVSKKDYEVLESYTKNADIIISALGIPGFVKKEMVKDGVVIIDVGITRVKDNNSPKGYVIRGDVDFDSVKEKASYITPVPGGVGPMTIAMLLKNTLLSKSLLKKNY